MAVTLSVSEGVPAAYPALTGLTAAAQALDPALVWQRLEAYTGWRWSERSCVWVVEGPGEWLAVPRPATIATVEVWSAAGVWEEAPDVSAGPLGGFWLPCTGPYRLSGTAGGGTVPAAVTEAARRLSEFFVSKPGRAPGSSSESLALDGAVTTTISRGPAWLADAMRNSGAADLLRPYRGAR